MAKTKKTASTTRAESDLQRALELSTTPVDQSFELALCLARLRKDRPRWKQYVQTPAISLRKAHFLAQIGGQWQGIRAPRKRLERLGWTKLQIIGLGITKDNLAKRLKMAEENTAHELKRLIREDTSQPAPKCVLLHLTPEQHHEFEKALLSNGAKRQGRGLANKEEAVINLIRKWERSQAKRRKPKAATPD